ncbi:MAG: hypothetical protein LUH19_01245 [Lachnospiraceae bacterium]|nr:hypothetical protein [Lachnospiraceae bacterium]
MRWTEQIRRDKKTLTRLNGKQKRQFVWDYYKQPILIAGVVLILGICGISMTLRAADVAFYAVLINANNEAQEDPFSPLLTAAGVDMEGKHVDIQANYTLRYEDSSTSDAQTIQVLAALFGIGDLDVFAADQAVFESYAGQQAFIDLSLFIPEELLEQYEAFLYYSESETGEEIVSGIWLREGSFLHTAGYYVDDVLVGVAANAQNLDNAILMVKQLLEDGSLGEESSS